MRFSCLCCVRPCRQLRLGQGLHTFTPCQQAAQLEEWDIVLYEVPGGRGPALGRVASVAADGVQVEKLEEDVANQVRTLG